MDLTKQADAIRKIGRTMGSISFDDIADGLVAAHSIHQAKTEREAELKQIGEQIAEANKELKNIKERVKNADAAAQERFDAEAKAHASIHAISLAKAQEEADKIISTANAQRDAIAEQIGIAEREHSALIEKIRAAELNLALINSNIEKVKQEAARLLGN